MAFKELYPVNPETMTKQCSKCGVAKNLECFTKNKAFKSGRGSVCKECTNAMQREYIRTVASKKPDFVARRAYAQEVARAKKYGMTVEQLRSLIKASSGRCQICGSPPSKTSRSTKSLHVDHCHKSGRVRGMICSRCNVTIGALEDDLSLLKKIMEYLIQGSAKNA